MKKLLLSALLMMSFTMHHGQDETVNGTLTVNGLTKIETNYDTPLNFYNTDDSWQYVQYFQSNIRKAYVGLDGNNRYVFGKENGGNFYFTGGNVGIGTSSPSSLLQLAGGLSGVQNTFGLDTNEWFNLGHISGYGTINWFTEANGSNDNYINTHSTVKAAQIRGGNGDVRIYTSPTHNGQGQISGLVERMRVNSIGYVGIGTDSPGKKLDVIGDIRATARLEGSELRVTNIVTNYVPYFNGSILDDSNIYNSGANVGINNTSPSHRLDINVGQANFKTYDYGAEIETNTSGGWARSLRIRNEFNNSNTAFGALSGTAYIATGFDTSVDATGYQNIKLAVDPQGKIGIGTYTPDAKFQIMEGNDGISLDASDDWIGIGFNRSVRTGQIYDAAKSGWQFTARDQFFSLEGYNGASSNLFTVTKTGNFGIGTTTPEAKLQVPAPYPQQTIGWSDMTQSGILVGTAASGIGIDANEIVGSGNDLYIGTKSAGAKVVFRAGSSTNRLTINGSSGKVGIGTDTPNGNLEVKGNTAVYSDFAGYTGETVNNYLPNGKEPTMVISENIGGTLIPATGGQVTYRGGMSFGRGGPGIYSINPNPAGSVYYGDLRFHTTYWNGSNYNNKDRMIIKHDGKVGIGTSNPLSDFHIEGNAPVITFKATNQGSGVRFNSVGQTGDLFRFQKDGETKMIMKNSGYVGIGTEDPDSKLTVDGDVNIGGNTNNSLKVRHINGKDFDSAEQDHLYLNYGNNKNVWIGSSGTPSNLIANGKVAVGRTTIPTGYQMAVDGKIMTKEVKVTLTGWSDFVFEKNYNLPSLKEVEKHISSHGHLKDIPSAKAVEKNGILLGEMDAKLLQKIEELTLYTIDQEKKIEKLQNENKQLKDLLDRVAKLESQLKNKK